MPISEVKNYLMSLTSHITFEYDGKSCGVDPLSKNKFDIWFGAEGITACSIDEVMTTKFFNGMSLEDIWDDITDLEF